MRQRFNLYKLQNNEMKELKAGKTCGCSCWAASTGGSSFWNNGGANSNEGLWSTKGTCTIFVSNSSNPF